MRGREGIEFETWISHEVPWKLFLSPSKEIAMKTYFSNFADRVRPLANKAPEEFNQFFNDFKEAIEEVSKFRAPKGTAVGLSIFKGDIERHPNCKPMYRLYDKKL